MYKSKLRKISNRDRILECIFRNMPISRTDIAELTEITPATTTTTVSELLADGVVEEQGEVATEESATGRKRIALGIRPGFGYTVGVEFTPKALVTCVADLSGRMTAQRLVPFSPELGKVITGRMIDEIAAVMADAGLPADRFVGIGIAVPGHMDEAEHRFITDQPGWEGFDADAVRRAFHLPLALENNVRCMAMAQYLFRREKTPDSFAFFHVGHGMFCANMADGELFLSNACLSGEIGHTIVNPEGQRCECGKRGCLQTVASERYLLQKGRELFESGASPLLCHLADSQADLTIDHLVTAYVMGDDMVVRYISDALRFLGIAISNLAILMSPGKIFLHGQMFNCPGIKAELLESIDGLLRFSDADDVSTAEVLPCLIEDGALGGCALAVLRCFLHGGKRD